MGRGGAEVKNKTQYMNSTEVNPNFTHTLKKI